MTTTSKDSRRQHGVATDDQPQTAPPEHGAEPGSPESRKGVAVPSKDQAEVDLKKTDSTKADGEDGAGSDSTSGSPSLVERVQALLAWWKTTRLARALTRYGQANGALLCGGIAYSAIFSLAAGLAIGYTIFMRVLGSNEELRDSVISSIDSALPGVLQTVPGDPTSGLIDPDSLVLSTGLNLVGIVSVVVLLVSAISCMGAIQVSVRAMFGLPPGGGNAVQVKLRQLGGFVVVGLSVLASAVVGIAVSSASTWALDLLGLEGGGRLLLPLLGFVVSFAVDMGVFFLVVRVLAGVHPPRADLLLGAVVAAAGFGIIRFLGTSVVAGGANDNALLVSFAAVITVLVWINLSARILLTAAAISADLPLELLEKVSDVEVAQQAIARARAGEPAPEDVAAERRAEVTVAAVTVRRRLVTLAAAGVGGYLLGRRRR